MDSGRPRMFGDYASAEALEQYLGDPSDPETPFSFRRAAELDERDEFPEAACRALDEWSLQEYYVPRACGGGLVSYPEVLALLRTVARRDLIVAIAHGGTSLGAVAVGLAGASAQQRRLAQRVRAGERIALALTERSHGSDLLASDVRASRVGDGFELPGEKWLIGNATRSSALTIFAWTGSDGGPRGFSLFLVEKDQLDASTFTHLPRVRTLGIRGTDISGIRFDQCAIPHASLVGSLGHGLEIVLKGLQITRSLVSSLSLGAADTALRITLSFALWRRLYGERVFDIPYARGLLVDAFVDVPICDCVALAAARALHAVPGQVGLWSAIVKYFVPIMVERVIQRLSVASDIGTVVMPIVTPPARRRWLDPGPSFGPRPTGR